VRFSESVRRLLPKAELDRAEGAYQRVRAFRVQVVSRGDLSSVPLAYALPYRTKCVFQAGLHRTLQLADATSSELDASRFVPSFLLARGCLETGCLMYDIILRVLAVIETPTEAGLLELAKHLERVAWGAKAPRVLEQIVEPGEDPADSSAVNIVTVIGRVARHHPQVQELYEHLSEFAHPNSAGMLGTFSHLDDNPNEFRFIDPWSDSSRTDALVYPVAGVGIGLTLTAKSNEILELRLEDFVRVTEQDLHNRGLWPPNAPYRWTASSGSPETADVPGKGGDA